MKRIAKINKLNLLRSYMLVSGTFFGMLSLFLPRKNRIIFNSSLNRYYNFNTKYLFEYFLERKSCPVYFVVNDPTLRNKLMNMHGPHFISSNGIRNKFFILCSKIWVTSTMETPVGGVFMSLGRFVYHLGHGVPVKKAGGAEVMVRWYKKLYYKFVETNFTAFLSPTQEAIRRYQQVYGCKSEKMVVNPQPRLSVMYPLPELSNKNFKVLYAPTWRHVDPVKLFPFDDYDESSLAKSLEEMNIEIYLHPHPIHSSVDFSSVKSSNLKVVFDLPGEDVNQYLSHYDLLVTDYSSIFVEFLALGRPVMFMPYDIATFDTKIGMFDFDGDLSTGPHVLNQNEFINELKKIRNGVDDFKSKRQELSHKLNGPDFKNACEINYQYLMSKLGS